MAVTRIIKFACHSSQLFLRAPPPGNYALEEKHIQSCTTAPTDLHPGKALLSALGCKVGMQTPNYFLQHV